MASESRTLKQADSKGEKGAPSDTRAVPRLMRALYDG